jgi:hypothetical protein
VLATKRCPFTVSSTSTCCDNDPYFLASRCSARSFFECVGGTFAARPERLRQQTPVRRSNDLLYTCLPFIASDYALVRRVDDGVESKGKEEVGGESGEVGVEGEGTRAKMPVREGSKSKGNGKERTSKIDELLPDGTFLQRGQLLCYSKPSLMGPIPFPLSVEGCPYGASTCTRYYEWYRVSALKRHIKAEHGGKLPGGWQPGPMRK